MKEENENFSVLRHELLGGGNKRWSAQNRPVLIKWIGRSFYVVCMQCFQLCFDLRDRFIIPEIVKKYNLIFNNLIARFVER